MEMGLGAVWPKMFFDFNEMHKASLWQIFGPEIMILADVDQIWSNWGSFMSMNKVVKSLLSKMVHIFCQIFQNCEDVKSPRLQIHSFFLRVSWSRVHETHFNHMCKCDITSHLVYVFCMFFQEKDVIEVASLIQWSDVPSKNPPAKTSHHNEKDVVGYFPSRSVFKSLTRMRLPVGLAGGVSSDTPTRSFSCKRFWKKWWMEDGISWFGG